MNAPKYVELPGSVTYPPPIAKLGCDTRIYVLAADRKPLQDTIDQWLNDLPINDVYDYVALPWVAMYTMPIKEVRVAGAKVGSPFCGFATETDIAFAVALAAIRKSPFHHEQPVVDHYAIAFPFILTNNPLGLTTGREIWGFRQALGNFECIPGTTMPIAASTLVMTSLTETSEQSLQEVMRMDGLIDDLALAPGGTVLGDLEHLLAGILEEGESLLQRLEAKVLGDVGRWILKHSLDARILLKELVKMLKQFQQINSAFVMQLRDCAAPDYAAYQALIEAPLKFIDFQSILPIPCTPVTLSEYDSYPLVSSLGIIHGGITQSGGHYTVKPLMAFEVRFSLELMYGRVIAEAGRVLMGATGMPLL